MTQDILTITRSMTSPPSGLIKELTDLIADMEENAASRSGVAKRLTITLSDNPYELFSSTTEVEGSCLSTDNEIDKSQCLLAYLIDGKNLLLALQEPTGKILARAIVRILWNEEQQTPAIFLERFYPTLLDGPHKTAMINLVKRHAQDLKLSLVTQVANTTKPYYGNLQSLGSDAEFEYTDGAVNASVGIGLYHRGVFTISKDLQEL